MVEIKAFRKVNIFTVKTEKPEAEDSAGNKRNNRDLAPVQEFIEMARETLKVTAKEFKFESGLSEKRETLRSQLTTKLKQNQKTLMDLC